MLQHFEKIIPSVKSLLSSLKMRYIVSVVALLRPVVSPNMVAILATILDFTDN